MTIAGSNAVARRFAYLAAALSLMLWTAPARADHGGEHRWSEPLGGAFETAANWDEGVPGTTDTAVFDLEETYTVDFSQDHENRRLLMKDGDVSFDLGTHVWTLTNIFGGASVIVGENSGDDATLRLLNGDVSSHAGIIGNLDNSAGSVLVTGNSSTWTNSGNLIVGNQATNSTTGELTIENGAEVSNAIGIVGRRSGATGIVTVTGDASLWHNNSGLFVGGDGTFGGGDGVVLVKDSATVSVSEELKIWAEGTVTLDGGQIDTTDFTNRGTFDHHDGTLTVDGGVFENTATPAALTLDGAATGDNPELRLINGASTQQILSLTVGDTHQATLTIESGASVEQTALGMIGFNSSSMGTVAVRGSDSSWDITARLTVGHHGAATLTVQDGGTVASTAGSIGAFENSTADVAVSGTDESGNPSTWIINGDSTDLRVGNLGAGTLTIEVGGRVENNPNGTIAFGAGSTGTVTVTGAGSMWTNNKSLYVGGYWDGAGGDGSLIVADSATVSVTDELKVWAGGTVTLDGGQITTTDFTNRGTLDHHDGRLTVDGGVFENSAAPANLILDGAAPGDNPELRLTGGASTQQIVDLIIGNSGTGKLTIQSGGSVENTLGFIGRNSGSTGTVTVSGTGSTWNNFESLDVGGSTIGGAGGTGTLTVESGGTVEIGDTLTLWDQGTVNLAGGTLHFDSDGFSREANGTLDYMAGTIQLAGDRDVGLDPVIDGFFGTAPEITPGKVLTVEGAANLVSSVTVDGGTLTVGSMQNGDLLDFQRGTLAITDQAVTIQSGGALGDTLDLAAGMTVDVALGITNRGLVTGDGRIGGPLQNEAGGELRVQLARSLTLTGAGNTNDGQIHLFGGLLDFTQDLTNNAGGLVSGNGTLLAGGGITNHGMMSFSGVANVVGDVHNTASGKVIAAGGGPTTFFDDVTNDGEIRTSPGGFAVFFGAVDGSGDFTGTGTVNFEGDLSPGSSPAEIEFGGNVQFGQLANLLVELAGTTEGAEYDALDIAGTAALDGTLDVSLINGFTPAAGDAFEILTAAGGITGSFASELLPALSGELFWDIDYGTNAVRLAVVAPGLPGDFNSDGSVDAADYVLWRKTDGTPNGYDTWRANFGRTAGSGALSNTTVPEPSSLVLLALTAAGLWRGRTRRTTIP